MLKTITKIFQENVIAFCKHGLLCANRSKLDFSSNSKCNRRNVTNLINMNLLRLGDHEIIATGLIHLL